MMLSIQRTVGELDGFVEFANATHLVGELDRSVTLQHGDPVLATGFDLLDQLLSAVPRVEGISSSCTFSIRFGLPDEVLGQLDRRLGVLLVQPISNGIARLVVGVEGVDEVLSQI